MAYATRADFENYVEGWVTDDPDALDRLLERASYDIDSVVGTYTLEANGLKFGDPQGANEKGLTPGQVVTLARATCAQADYRDEMGEEFFAKDQYEDVEGPDFRRQGKLAYIAPKALRELGVGGFVKTRSRIRQIVTTGLASDAPA